MITYIAERRDKSNAKYFIIKSFYSFDTAQRDS